ncbi:MAG: hypothetical protein NT118_13080 [Lentisphaerae bacterium]|nr:hypothetical protein [Lentisphaerota bacterium]
MSAIKFSCNECLEELEADPDMQGELIECPACNSSITVPHKQKGVRVSNSSSKGNTCPKCGSESIARCEMVYASGTKTGTISGTMIGFDVGNDGISPRIGVGSVGTQSQSLIAQYASPPEKPMSRNVKWGLFGLFVGFLPLVFAIIVRLLSTDILLSSSVDIFSISLIALVIGPIIGLIFASIAGKSKEEKEYGGKMGAWRLSWICTTCGNKWILKK